jgi:hypothetical protein
LPHVFWRMSTALSSSGYLCMKASSS